MSTSKFLLAWVANRGLPKNTANKIRQARKLCNVIESLYASQNASNNDEVNKSIEDAQNKVEAILGAIKGVSRVYWPGIFPSFELNGVTENLF